MRVNGKPTETIPHSRLHSAGEDFAAVSNSESRSRRPDRVKQTVTHIGL